MIDELVAQIIKEATTTVEKELSIEDEGWTKLGQTGFSAMTSAKRVDYVKQSRIYHALDPLAHQAIRLWTDYTFGSGMSFNATDEKANKVIQAFWNDRDNRAILSASGQRKDSDKLLVDGEVFFALFLGPKGKAIIRTIDPLEITEIITDKEDINKVLYYKREWYDSQGKGFTSYYRSFDNPKGLPGKDYAGATVGKTEEALVYHLAYNTIEQRGNPLLLPALDWIKQYRRFLASRVAVMLSLAKFAWKIKVAGGSSTVSSVKAVFQDEVPASGSMAVENASSDLQPIKVDTGSSNAYQDGRMLKLQVAAAVGIPEQYFGDISIGNLATAKTVELPMMKQFQSYQKVWSDAYQTIDEMVLEHNSISPDKWYIDRDFPAIALEDSLMVAQAMAQIITAFPEFANSPDVQQQALIALGINDPGEVIDSLSKESISNPSIKLAKALRDFKEAMIQNGKKGKEGS